MIDLYKVKIKMCVDKPPLFNDVFCGFFFKLS